MSDNRVDSKLSHMLGYRLHLKQTKQMRQLQRAKQLLQICDEVFAHGIGIQAFTIT